MDLLNSAFSSLEVTVQAAQLAVHTGPLPLLSCYLCVLSLSLASPLSPNWYNPAVLSYGRATKRCGLGERSGVLLLHVVTEKPGLEIDACDGNPLGEDIETKVKC